MKRTINTVTGWFADVWYLVRALCFYAVEVVRINQPRESSDVVRIRREIKACEGYLASNLLSDSSRCFYEQWLTQLRASASIIFLSKPTIPKFAKLRFPRFVKPAHIEDIKSGMSKAERDAVVSHMHKVVSEALQPRVLPTVQAFQSDLVSFANAVNRSPKARLTSLFNSR